MQLSDIPTHLLQLSSSRPEASFNLPLSNLPVSMRPCTSFSDTDLGNGSITVGGANGFSLQGMLGRSHLGAFTSDDNDQSVAQEPPAPPQPQPQPLQPPQQQPQSQSQQQCQQGALPVASSLSSLETQIIGSWFPSTRETNQSDSSMFLNMQTGQSDASSTITSRSFSLPAEPLGMSTDNSLVLPSTIASFQSRAVNMNKDMQCQVMNGGMLVGSLSSPCASFTSAASNVPLNPGMMVNGGLDEALLPRGCNWSQVSAPVRTFTKVQKLGSVGRSIDVSRFKNYDELRRELAHMFNLEGQLEDPQRSGWQLVFVDNEKDILLVGDDPWDEFVNCVRTIKILSPMQVLQMNREGLEPLSALPMQQQTSSSSEDCLVWKDTHDPIGGSMEHGTT